MRVPVWVTMYDESTRVGEGGLVNLWVYAYERLHMGTCV